MDKFIVKLLPQAEKFYRNCPFSLARRLNRCFEQLEKNPFSGPNIGIVRGKKKFYRCRVGNYRIIYENENESNNKGFVL